MTKEQKECIDMIENGLSAEYIWSDFVMYWSEKEWLEKSPEIREYVSSLAEQYRKGEL